MPKKKNKHYKPQNHTDSKGIISTYRNGYNQGLCFIIFSLGRLFELAIVVRECDEKIEELNSELAILTEWIGDNNAEEKE